MTLGIELIWNTTKVKLQAGQTFLQFGPGQPDVFLFPDDGCLLIANGLVDPSKPAAKFGLMVGSFAIGGSGGLIQAPVSIELHDGNYRVFRINPMPRQLWAPAEWREHWMAHWPKDPETHQKYVERLEQHDYRLNEADFQSPDVPQASTQRCKQSAWAGTLALCVGAATEGVRAAALDYVDAQGKRPILYYTASGELYTSPLIWIDERGWRKGYHGQYERKSTCLATLEDNEHLAPHRLLTAAVHLGDPVAELICTAYLNALLSRPSVAFVLPIQQARSAGYLMETLARFYVFHEASERVLSGLKTCLASIQMTCRFAPNGNPEALLWPVDKVHGDTHVHPTPKDAQRYIKAMGWTLEGESGWTLAAYIVWLQNQAMLDGLKKTAYTTDPAGLQWYLQGSTIWGLAIAARGVRVAGQLLEQVHEQGADPLAGVWKVFGHLGMAVRRGSLPGIDEDAGLFNPAPLHDSLAPRCNRALQANIPFGGTLVFCIPALLEMGDTEIEIARKIYANDSLKLSDPSLACMEHAGLKAMSTFGAT